MVLSFLLISDVIWYLFVLLTAFVANSFLVYYAVLFISLRFSLLVVPNSLLAVLLLHRTIIAHQIAGIFSWTVNSAFIHEDGKF
jgi:hypothetical protein